MAQPTHGALRPVWPIGSPPLNSTSNRFGRGGSQSQKLLWVRKSREIGPICRWRIFLLVGWITMSGNVTIVTQYALQRRALDLSRRIYTSLPWGYRVAELFMVLGADAASALGSASYALFIAAVVRGLPTVNGRDALDLVQDIRGPEDADKLPADYGRAFGGRVYRVLLARFGPEIAEEAMSETLLKIVRGKIHVRNGANLAESEALIVTVALNSARDQARRQQRIRREVSDSDDEGTTIDVEDPEAFRQLDNLLPASELRQVLRELGQVHPRAPEWLQARLQGDSGQEIAREWQTTPSYVSKWQRIYLPRIRQVVEHHLRQGHRRYSYDRRVTL